MEKTYAEDVLGLTEKQMAVLREATSAPEGKTWCHPSTAKSLVKRGLGDGFGQYCFRINDKGRASLTMQHMRSECAAGLECPYHRSAMGVPVA